MKVLREGQGPKVSNGQKVAVHYAGRVLKSDGSLGEVFDNSYERGKPFIFTLGQGQVIAGWEQGLL